MGKPIKAADKAAKGNKFGGEMPKTNKEDKVKKSKKEVSKLSKTAVGGKVYFTKTSLYSYATQHTNVATIKNDFVRYGHRRRHEFDDR